MFTVRPVSAGDAGGDGAYAEGFEQPGLAGVHFERLETVDASVEAGLGVTVEADGAVSTGRQGDGAAIPVREFVALGGAAIRGEEVEAHGLGRGVGGVGPVEYHGQSPRVEMVVA